MMAQLPKNGNKERLRRGFESRREHKRIKLLVGCSFFYLPKIYNIKYPTDRMKKEVKEEGEESFWGDGGYIRSISSEEFKAKEKSIEQDTNEELKFNCKKCNRKIGIHNKDWHEGMCNDCFFDEYNM